MRHKRPCPAGSILGKDQGLLGGVSHELMALAIHEETPLAMEMEVDEWYVGGRRLSEII